MCEHRDSINTLIRICAMKKLLSLFAVVVFAIGCAPTKQAEQAASAVPAEPDYGNFSSETLTVNAWNALTARQYDLAILYTKKCIELYETRAKEMQASLNAKAPHDKVHDYWALNDVGTSYFIMGEALTQQRKYAEAQAAYTVVTDEFKYAQTWDPKGWFWSPADAAYPKVEWLKLKTNNDF